MHKKKLILLVFIIVLLTGCIKIDNNLDEIVDTIMNSKIDYVNTVSTGYELYIPTGVKQDKDNEYNQKFKIKDSYVYLYVDTISYYYKNTLNYQSHDNYDYYFKELSSNNDGYIGINKVEDDLYFITIVYNYSKIEFYSPMSYMDTIIANSLIIIKSIKFNDTLINKELENDTSEGREIKYELDSPKDSQSTFSDVLQEYVAEEDEEIILPEDN